MNDIVLVKELLVEILQKMGVCFSEVEVREEEDGNVLRANIISEDAPLLIGFKGKNLEALQHLFRIMLWEKNLSKEKLVMVDVDGYKESAEEKLLGIAREKAQMVLLTGAIQSMIALTPVQRRMVHLELSKEEFSGVKTESVNDDFGNRVLKIMKA